MPCDELTSYYTDLLDGSYSCLDRLVLNANFAPCYSAGGFRWWWRQLHNGSDEELDEAHLMRMAGHFGRRMRGWAKANQVPIIDCRREEDNLHRRLQPAERQRGLAFSDGRRRKHQAARGRSWFSLHVG